MKKIMFFCDHCKDPIATQRLSSEMQEEKHLIPMGYEEWCTDCVKIYHIKVLQTPNIYDTAYEHGELTK